MENRVERRQTPEESRFDTFRSGIRAMLKRNGDEAKIIASNPDGQSHLELADSGDWNIKRPEGDEAQGRLVGLYTAAELYASITDVTYTAVQDRGLANGTYVRDMEAYFRLNRATHVSGLLSAMEAALNEGV